MFQLSLLSDYISINPRHLLRPFPVVVLHALQKKYSNKVCSLKVTLKIIAGLGLCISIFDVVEIKDPIVHIGQGRPSSSGLYF